MNTKNILIWQCSNVGHTEEHYVASFHKKNFQQEGIFQIKSNLISLQVSKSRLSHLSKGTQPGEWEIGIRELENFSKLNI